MVVPFGVSVGDFISGIQLIHTIIEALEDSAGSSAEYQGIIRELKGLESALNCVMDLDIEDEAQEVAMREAAAQCSKTIQEFLQKVKKYQPALQAGGSTRKWKDNLRKIQWSFYSKEDVRRFQAQLQGHTASIQILLQRIHM